MNFPIFHLFPILFFLNQLDYIQLLTNYNQQQSDNNLPQFKPFDDPLVSTNDDNLQQSTTTTESLIDSPSPNHFDHWPHEMDSLYYHHPELTTHSYYNYPSNRNNLMEPLADNLDYVDDLPDEIPTGEINYSDNISLEGEEAINGDGEEDELVLSNFHKTIDNSGNNWNTYDDQYSVSDFQCSNKLYAGYYADVQSNCQVWHLCESNGRHHTFTCPNETLFNQLYRVCDWWYNVDCPKSREYYHINRDHGLINHHDSASRYRPPITTTTTSQQSGDLNIQTIDDEIDSPLIDDDEQLILGSQKKSTIKSFT